MRTLASLISVGLASILLSGCPGPGARPGQGAVTRIDLMVALEGIPEVLRPGDSLGAGARAVARNVGEGLASGSRPDQHGYMIDVVLSRDETVPDGFATFHETFREDVLLRGGRASNTSDLAAGASAAFDIENDTIPPDTPPGDYFLCARIDPGSVVAESNETNNVSCRPVKVQAATTMGGCKGIGVTTRVEGVSDLGSLPDGMSINWPRAPSIERDIRVNISEDFETAVKSGTRFHFENNILDRAVAVDASDVEIVIMPGVKLRNIALGSSAHRVKISGGEVGQISAVRFPSGTDDSGYITDVLIDKITVNSDESLLCPGSTNECFGIMLRGVRRVAVVNSSVNSLVYSVWADAQTSDPAITAQNEDIIIANNHMHSMLGEQATVRMHDSIRTVTVNNRLENDGSSGDWRHNYRIHGRASYVYAACNVFVNSGVMIGEGGGGPEDVRYYWFNNNQFHQLASSLYQMGLSNVLNVEIRGNRAYSNSHSCFYLVDCRDDTRTPPADWVIVDNVVEPYIPPPP